MIARLPRPRLLASAVGAGVIAGVTIVVCISALSALVPRSAPFLLSRFFAFDASALVGPVAYTNGNYVTLGVCLHFAVAIGWALGYAVVAERQRQLVSRPFISGAGFGLVVYFAMQLVLVAANLYRTPTPGGLGVALLAHLAFYGIPVALIVSRTLRSS